MSNDWRVQVRCENHSTAELLAEKLKRGELEHQLDTSAGQRVAVSRDDESVFLYAGDEAQAKAAQAAVTGLATSLGVKVELELRRWHPVAEEWENRDQPLPDDRRELTGELAAEAAREDLESQQLGFAEFEVRVHLHSHDEIVAFGALLHARGLPYVRRWRYIMIGAGDELAANKLADELRANAPEGAQITVEGTAEAAEAGMPQNPFAVFGGLGV